MKFPASPLAALWAFLFLQNLVIGCRSESSKSSDDGASDADRDKISQTEAGKLLISGTIGPDEINVVAGIEVKAAEYPEVVTTTDSAGAFVLAIDLNQQSEPNALYARGSAMSLVSALPSLTVYGTHASQGGSQGFQSIVENLSAGERTLGKILLKPTGSISVKIQLSEKSDHSGISVYIPGTGFNGKTDGNGDVNIENIPPGLWKIVGEYDGYLKSEVDSVQVAPSTTTRLNTLTLVPSTGVKAKIEANRGEKHSPTLTVPFKITYSGDVTLMRMSEDPTGLQSEWQPAKKEITWTFSSEGQKDLYFFFSDANGLTSPPQKTTIFVNDRDEDTVANRADCAPDDKDRWQLMNYLFRDLDGDGAFVGTQGQICAGDSLPTGYANTSSGSTDCSDVDGGASERLFFYVDADDDGVGGALTAICGKTGVTPDGFSENGGDCNDNNATLYGLLSGYPDIDNDLKGNGNLVDVCSGAALPSGFVSNNSDFFPSDPNRWTFGSLITVGGTGTEQLADAETDSVGNDYYTGMFSAAVDFDHTSGISNRSPVGWTSVFLTKIAQDGSYSWTREIAGAASKEDRVKRLAIDSAGSIVVAGFFNGSSIDFNWGAGTDTRSATQADGFVTKVMPDGSYAWTVTIPGSGNDGVEAVAAGPNNQIVFGGYFSGTVNFDHTASLATPVAANGWDGFVVKVNDVGAYQWHKTWTAANYDDYVSAIALDAQGNTIVGGQFLGTMDLDPGASTNNATSTGSLDVWLTKLDPNGDTIWTRSLGGSSVDYLTDLGTDAAGNIYLLGVFSQTVDFDPTSGEDYKQTNGSEDIFVTKILANGSYGWTRTFGGTYRDGLTDQTIGRGSLKISGSNILVTGTFGAALSGGISGRSDIDFDFTAGTDIHTSRGDANGFMTLMTTNGEYKWTRSIGYSELNGNINDAGVAGTFAPGNKVRFYGRFSGTFDFDFTDGAAFRSSMGSWDIFRLEF